MNFMCQCFGTLCLFHLHRRVGMKNIQHSEHSKSLKSRIIHLYWEEIARHIRQRATFRTWREFEIKKIKISHHNISHTPLLVLATDTNRIYRLCCVDCNIYLRVHHITGE